MPFCEICDSEVPDESAAWFDSRTIADAVKAGLRPPVGKLKRTAAMLVKGDLAVAEKAAELEREWVSGFIRRAAEPDGICVCGDCKLSAGTKLNRFL